MTAMTNPSWAQVRGPLAPFADGFRAELERLGYTPLTAATHVRLMAHLSRWLAREGVEPSGLTPAVVDAYFAERRAAGYAGQVTGRALQPLAGYLRRLGVVPPAVPAAAASPGERLLGFLHVEGIIGQPLAAAVPSPAGWTQAGLPKALDGDQVAALLASCDPGTRTGRRDLAILTLLARLGLRARPRSAPSRPE